MADVEIKYKDSGPITPNDTQHTPYVSLPQEMAPITANELPEDKLQEALQKEHQAQADLTAHVTNVHSTVPGVTPGVPAVEGHNGPLGEPAPEAPAT